jgi:hypothetical protein
MTTIAILAILAILGGIATLSLSRKVSMTTIVADKLKRRLTTTSATTVITTLSFTLLLTFVTFVSLTQTSFAQTPNTNQTSTAQPKLITYPCKLTESTVQGPEYKAGAPFKQGQDFAKVKDTLITKPVTDANGTKVANFDFVVEDHRGFDASQGLRDNPTVGALGGSNK